MATRNAFYVRGGTDDPAIAAIVRAKFPNWIEIRTNKQFWGVEFDGYPDRKAELELMELSSRLEADVLWLGFQSTSSSFWFHHWRAGEHSRSLVFVESAWERAEGTPEPWEREVLFDRDDLADLLEDMNELGESEDEKREVKRIWRDAQIRPGQVAPIVLERSCARKVAAHFHLPGWS